MNLLAARKMFFTRRRGTKPYFLYMKPIDRYAGNKGYNRNAAVAPADETVYNKRYCNGCIERRVRPVSMSIGGLWEVCKACAAEDIAEEYDWKCPDCETDMALTPYQFCWFDVNVRDYYRLVCLDCWRKRCKIQNILIKNLSGPKGDPVELSRAIKEIEADCLWMDVDGKYCTLYLDHIVREDASKNIRRLRDARSRRDRGLEC